MPKYTEEQFEKDLMSRWTHAKETQPEEEYRKTCLDILEKILIQNADILKRLKDK